MRKEGLAMRFGRTAIVAKKGDITQEDVGALVNTANSSLMGGSGVDGAIHRAGGPEILQECKKIRKEKGKCSRGSAVITCGGALKVRYVIHAVGPVWHGGGDGEAEALSSAYESCLRLAEEHKVKTLAFPSISTGAYGYPITLAAPIAVGAVRQFCELSQFLDEVRFVLFSDADLEEYRKVLELVG